LRKQLILIILIITTLFACKKKEFEVPSNYYEVPATTENAVNMVVEIPAGTNHKIEYDPATDSFKNDMKDGKIRVVSFLPYPGNYGFIPSTLMNKDQGGDGDALDILVIGESEPTGKVLEVKPIAALLLIDGGEIDTKLLAIPADPEKQVISPGSFQEFIMQHDAIRMIVENWFLNYKGHGVMQLQGWRDEGYAYREIEKWKTEGK